MTNIQLGKNGEEIAQQYLIKQGYKILEKNKRFSNFCEIDIIAQDKQTVVFVEVKTRKTTFCGHPLEAITKSKYSKIKQGLFFYMKEHNEFKKYRIDAISIILKPTIDIKHFKNICF